MGLAFVPLYLVAGALGDQSSVLATAPGESLGLPDLSSGSLVVQASVDSQSRAGESPLLAGAEPQPFVAEMLTPRLALELRRPETILVAAYAPRIFWEDPNPASTSGPLVLHVAQVELDARPSRTLTTKASIVGSVGEPDYTTLPQVLGTVQGALPPVVKLASVNGQASVADELTPLWGAGLRLQVFSWRWLDVPAGLPSGTITGFTSVNAEGTAALRLSTRDKLGVGVTFGEALYSFGNGIATLTPTTSWKRRLARRSELTLVLGVTYAHVVGSPPTGSMLPLLGSSGSTASPIGAAEVVTRIARVNEFLLQSRASAGVDFYVDPVLGVGIPRGSASVALTALSATYWTTSLSGDFATALRTVPTVPGELPPDETVFSLTVSVRRQVNENLFAELGGRWADRGPVLSTPDFQFHQRQLWIYLSLTGTTKPIPRPSLPTQ